MKLIYATQFNPTASPPSCLRPSLLLLSCLGVKRDTGSSQPHSFHFAEERRGSEGNLSPKLSVLLAPYF